jgi:hypothetical protein
VPVCASGCASRHATTPLRPAQGTAAFEQPVLKTGNGRQGHSWVRIPPPPLARSAKFRMVGRIATRSDWASGIPFSPPGSAGVRRLLHLGGAMGAQNSAATRLVDGFVHRCSRPCAACMRVGRPCPAGKVDREGETPQKRGKVGSHASRGSRPPEKTDREGETPQKRGNPSVPALIVFGKPTLVRQR